MATEPEDSNEELRGCYVKTPYGWGICIADDPTELHLKVELDWRLLNRRRVPCSVRRADVSARSFCAVGQCVLTSFGTGVLLGFRPEDGIYRVQLWGSLGNGRNIAYLGSAALLKVLPAAAGLSVETAYGTGVCRGVLGLHALAYNETGDLAIPGGGEAAGMRDDVVTSSAISTAADAGLKSSPPISLVVDLPWGRAYLAAGVVRCPVALTLPLVERFMERAAALLKLHSGTLFRLQEAFKGFGLERLQERLSTSAGEVIEAANRVWDDIEAKGSDEVVGSIRQLADPQIDRLIEAAIARLDNLANGVAAFDGKWFGKLDDGLRCTIQDGTILWHWGDASDLEMWSQDEVSTKVEADHFRGKLNENGELVWSDGDTWIRKVASEAGTTRLDNEARGVAAFDGRWLGKSDGGLRCTIQDGSILWHWGDSSVLKMSSQNEVSTQVQADVVRGKLQENQDLVWSDGDIWIREVKDGETTDSVQLGVPAVIKSKVTDGMSDLRRLVGKHGLDEDIEKAMTSIAEAATGDEEVKRIVGEVRKRQQELYGLKDQVFESRTIKAILAKKSTFQERMGRIKDTALAPQFQRIQTRGKRLFTRLSTDRKIKKKAAELIAAAQARFTAAEDGGEIGGFKAWVTSTKDRVVGRLGMHRAMLVECLGDGGVLQVNQEDLRRLITNSWDQKALEAQLNDILVRTIRLSGIACSGTELLDTFESSALISELPAVQQTYRGLLVALADLNIEVPTPLQKLIEARADGCSHDVKAWQTAIMDSLDDDGVVKRAEDFLTKGEMVLSNFEGLGRNDAFAKVMEHLEGVDLERNMLNKLHDIDPAAVLRKAEEALTSFEVRNELVNSMTDTCLDFVLKVLPKIRVDKIAGEELGFEWELSDISFSDFSLKKENFHIVLGRPGEDEDLVTVIADDIGANFPDIKVSAKQTQFPFLHPQVSADARGQQMKVVLAFRLEHSPSSAEQLPRREAESLMVQLFPQGPQMPKLVGTAGETAAPQTPVPIPAGTPQLVLRRREVSMQNLELSIRQSSYSPIVNALTFIFADFLKDYACEKIERMLDKHTGTLMQALNGVIATSAPTFARFGLQLPTSHAANTGVVVEPEFEPACFDEDDDLLLLDWPDPGRSFVARL
eukprot:TRINITY_DN36548_c0_g1_i1.p1 TRINITY_DN36548_c0_g1~~TRINITY_DN36548_c0_g1_i1.p1  ORF type:complete len:1139 (-),score=233.74 TRINITY_DN36548_c0_g1_i1:121-3513(-)